MTPVRGLIAGATGCAIVVVNMMVLATYQPAVAEIAAHIGWTTAAVGVFLLVLALAEDASA